MRKHILYFFTCSLLTVTQGYGCDNALVSHTADEDLLTQWFRPTSLPKSVYDTKLPTDGEIKFVTPFLKEAPRSSGIEDQGAFYNSFLTLIQELKSFKSTKLDKLNDAAYCFFINLYQHANNWIIDQAQDYHSNLILDGVGNKEIMVDVKCTHLAYLEKFQRQFLVFQRVANNYFNILAECGCHDLESCFGHVDYKFVLTSQNGILDKSQLGYLKDENGYLPFRIVTSQSIKTVDLYYGQPIVMRDQHFLRRIVIENNQIIPQTGLIVKPYPNRNLPISIELYSGTFFSQWSKVLYINPGNMDRSHMHGLPGQLCGIVDYNDIIVNQRTYFLPLPTTDKEKYIVNIMLLEHLIEVKKSNTLNQDAPALQAIKYLEAAAGISIEEFKESVETALFSECVTEVMDEIHLEQIETVASTQTAPKTIAKPKRYKQTKRNRHKIVAKTETKQPQQQMPNSEDIQIRAKKLMDTYKVNGRKKFSAVSALLNNVLKDEKAFKEAGVDLKKALKDFDVNIIGSHITIHKEGADTTSTLVKKHGKKDKDYYPSEVNGFVENFITQLFSHSFK